MITDEASKELTHAGAAVHIAVNSSARNRVVVGMGGAINTQASSQHDPTTETFASTLGIRTEQNPFSGELTAMAAALSQLPRLRYRSIVLLMRSKSAALTIRQPWQQSGQEQVYRVYESIRKLRREGNTMRAVWLPSSEECELLTLAKEKAKMATQQGTTPQTQLPNMRSTTLRVARAKRDTTRHLPENVGNTPKELIQLYQANTRDNYTIDYLGKKLTY